MPKHVAHHVGDVQAAQGQAVERQGQHTQAAQLGRQASIQAGVGRAVSPSHQHGRNLARLQAGQYLCATPAKGCLKVALFLLGSAARSRHRPRRNPQLAGKGLQIPRQHAGP